jgi:hypothetical protein
MLNKAIKERLDGTESLAGYPDQVAAQAVTAAVRIRQGSLSADAVLPAITFNEDAGTESLQGVDVGIVSNSVYRFQIWQPDSDRSGSTISHLADCLEVLLDQRRGAPKLTIVGYGRVFWADLFVSLQSPLHDDNINAFFGLMSFRIVESRP